MNGRKGRITSIEADVYTEREIVVGIPKERQKNYSAHYGGGNGTYVRTTLSIPQIILKATIYEDAENETEWVSFDIRPQVMAAHPDWHKLSAQRLAKLKEDNQGRKVTFYEQNGSYAIPDLLL